MVDVRSTEEILKAYKNVTYERTDRNGTRYFRNHTCDRCGGAGGWAGWPGFVCYDCGGSGTDPIGSLFKIYTPEYEAKLTAQREARAQKRQQEREAKARAERPQNLEKAGFGKEEDAYVIYRVVGNTYPIKDELKTLGCKFNRAVGWFSSKNLEDYECQRMEESQVLTDSVFIEWKDKEEVEKLFVENLQKPESRSKWVGEVGERLDLYLHIDRAIECETYNRYSHRHETSYMYLMSDEDENVFKWFTTCFYKDGDDVHFRATVKDHSEYKGVAQTVLTRCTKVKGE